MTILSVAQDIAPLIGIDKPSVLMASTDNVHVELAQIANRAADYICGASDWTLFSTKHTMVGDGVSTFFNFPADYQKFTDDSNGEPRIYSPIMAGALHRVSDMNEWLYRDVKQIGLVTYSWIVYGGGVHIKPALPDGVGASFFYQSKKVVTDNALTPVFKAVFTSDGDSFRLDERMLNLCMLWMWRHSKGQTYAQYQQEFEKRKSEIALADKGPRTISFGRTKSSFGASVAYPFELS